MNPTELHAHGVRAKRPHDEDFTLFLVNPQCEFYSSNPLAAEIIAEAILNHVMPFHEVYCLMGGLSHRDDYALAEQIEGSLTKANALGTKVFFLPSDSKVEKITFEEGLFHHCVFAGLVASKVETLCASLASRGDGFEIHALAICQLSDGVKKLEPSDLGIQIAKPPSVIEDDDMTSGGYDHCGEQPPLHASLHQVSRLPRLGANRAVHVVYHTGTHYQGGGDYYFPIPWTLLKPGETALNALFNRLGGDKTVEVKVIYRGHYSSALDSKFAWVQTVVFAQKVAPSVLTKPLPLFLLQEEDSEIFNSL